MFEIHSHHSHNEEQKQINCRLELWGWRERIKKLMGRWFCRLVLELIEWFGSAIIEIKFLLWLLPRATAARSQPCRVTATKSLAWMIPFSTQTLCRNWKINTTWGSNWGGGSLGLSGRVRIRWPERFWPANPLQRIDWSPQTIFAVWS